MGWPNRRRGGIAGEHAAGFQSEITGAGQTTGRPAGSTAECDLKVIFDARRKIYQALIANEFLKEPGSGKRPDDCARDRRKIQPLSATNRIAP